MTKFESLPSGAARMTYDDVPPKDFEFAIGNEKNIDTISEHIEKHVGHIEKVFHELLSDKIHVDIHWVAPSEERPYNVLVTSGMGDRPMTVPEGLEEFQYAELYLLLPPDWPLDKKSFEDENNYWPIRWMTQLARFPHEYDTFFCMEHSIGGQENAAMFPPNCPFSGFLFFTSVSLPEEFATLRLETGETIHFYCLIPLYAEEIDLKNNEGLDALLERFEKIGVTDIIDIHRENSCPG
jgi:hypothetical protein